MPHDPILHLLGLAKKAGRLEIGEEPVGAACRARQARLVLVAGDAAPNTRRRCAHFGEAGNVLWLEVPFSKAELGACFSRTSCALLALTDAGFAADTDPYIKVKVNDDLDAGTQIVNTTDVGGRKGHEWTYDRDSWITVVYKGSGSSDGGHGGKKLPQTGGPNFFEQYPEYLKYLED